MKRKLLSLFLALSLMLLLAAGASAAEVSANVVDTAGLLTDEQTRTLDTQAAAVSSKHGVGIYIVTVPDYRELDNSGVYEATYGIYHALSLGEGADRDGIILLLSMEDRDFATFCHGKTAERTFSDYALQQMEEKFLDDFRENDWYGGFLDYVNCCDDYLTRAEAGKPVRESAMPRILLFCGIALVVAGIVCLVLVLQMKSVAKKTTAGAYAVGGLQLTGHYDRFTHRTETRRKIETNSGSSGGGSSGGSSHSGGGGHGRSGKF